MSDSINDLLRPAQLASLLGIKTRQTARVLAELEAVGYKLTVDGSGARRCPPELAHAVQVARDAGHELLTLRLQPGLNRFLRRGRAVEPDPLELLIELSAEIGIVREIAGTLAEGARLALPAGWTAPSWSSLSLPDPRIDL